MTIIIIIALITIVIFLIRVKFKLTYIFYTKKNNVGLFVLYKVKHQEKQNGLDMLLLPRIIEECLNCKCKSSSPNNFY